MKVFSFVFCFFISLCCHAHTWYVSNTGSPANAGTRNAPWNYARLQAEAAKSGGSLIRPGDSVLLARGQRFSGTLAWKVPGRAAAPIYIGAYGTGNKPSLSGLATLTDWVKAGPNKYLSAGPVSSLDNCNMVLLNGRPVSMGRWPNATNSADDQFWGMFKSVDGNGTSTMLIDSALQLPLVTAASLVGARVVTRDERWVWDTARVLSVTGGSYMPGGPTTRTILNLSGGRQYDQRSGWGHFFMNKAEFCDLPSEWHYDYNSHKLLVNLAAAPSTYTIQATTVDYLLTLHDASYLTFENLRFEGANQTAVLPKGKNNHIAFNSCEWQYIASKGWDTNNTGGVSNITFDGCSFQDVGNMGIDHRASGSHYSVKNSLFKRIGMLIGMSAVDIGQMMCGIRGGGGTHHYYGFNTFDSIGYCAIRWNQAGTIVERNDLQNYCMWLDDCAAIYTGNDVLKNGAKVRWNKAVYAGAGMPMIGTNTTSARVVYGIYLDDGAHGTPDSPIEVYGNICINNPKGGLYLHNNQHVRVTDNTFWGNKECQLQITNDASALKATKGPGKDYDDSTNSITVRGNKLVSTSADPKDYILKLYTLWPSPSYIKQFGSTPGGARTGVPQGIDNNYYFKPLAPDAPFIALIWNLYNKQAPEMGEQRRFLKLPEFSAQFGYDAATRTCPVQFKRGTAAEDAMLLLYNLSERDSTVVLTRRWKDEEGNIINPGRYVLKPFQTRVLCRWDGASTAAFKR